MSRSRTAARRPAVLVGAAALALVLAGCSDPPQGTVTATNGRVVETFSNPKSTACQNFSIPAVTQISNMTLADMRLYTGRNCTNPVSPSPFYLSTNTSVGPNGTTYRSFAFVGQ